MTRLQVLVVWAALAVARTHMYTHAHALASHARARAHTDHRLRSPHLPAAAAPRAAPQRSTLDSEEEIDDSNVDIANTTRRVPATRGDGEIHNAADDVTARPRADLPAISRTPRRSTRARPRTDDPQPREPSSPPAGWDRSARSRRRHPQPDRDNLITNSQRSPEARKRSKKRGKKKTRPVSGDKRKNGSTTHSENQGLTVSSRVIDGGKNRDESEESNTRVHTLRGDSLRRSRSRNRGVKKFEEELGHATVKDDERRSVVRQISSPVAEDQVNGDRVSAATIHKLQEDVQPVGSSRVTDLAQEANHDVYVPRLRKNNEDGGIKLLEIVERELAKIDPNDTIKYQVNEKPNLASDKERNGDNSQTYFHMRGRNSNREHPEEVAFDSVDTKNGDVSSNTRDSSKLFQAEQLEEESEEPEFDYYSECLDLSGITCNNNQDTRRKLEYDDDRRNDKKYDHTPTRKSDETDYYTLGNSPATSNEDKELLDETQKRVKGVQTDELVSSQRDKGTKERIVSIPNMYEDIREGSPFYEYSYSRPKVNPYLYTSNKDYERYWHALSPKDPTERSREEVLKSREPGNERETILVEPKGDNSSDRVSEPPRNAYNERLEEIQDELTKNVRTNAKTHENAYSKMMDEPHTHRYSQGKDDKILSEDMEEDGREVIKNDSSDREEEPITESLADLKEPINTERNGKSLYEPKPGNREHNIYEEQEKTGNVGREPTKEEKERNAKLPAEEDKEISQKQNDRTPKIENSFYPYSKRTEPSHYMYDDDEEDGYPFYENTYRVPIVKLRERMNENDETRSGSKLSFKEEDVDNKYSGQEEEKAREQQTSSEGEGKYPHLENHGPSQIFHGEDGKRNQTVTIYEELNDKRDDETLHSDSSGSSKDTAPIVYKNEEKEQKDQYLNREEDENNSEEFSQSQEPSKNMDDEKETVPNYDDVSNNHERLNKNIDGTNVEPERYVVHHSYRPSEDEILNLPVSGDSEETKVEPKPKQEKAVNREDIKYDSYSGHLEGHKGLQSSKEEISQESAPRTNGRYTIKSRSPKQLLNSRYQSAEPIQDADKDDKEPGPHHPTETMESETLHYSGGSQRTRSGIRSARPERSRNIQRKQNQSSESQHLQRQRNNTRRKTQMNPPERTTRRSHTDSESEDYTEEIDNVANENTDHLLNSQTPESQERQPERSDITEVLPPRKPVNRIRTSRNHNRARFEEQQDQSRSNERAKALVGARPTRASRGGYHRSQRDDWTSEPRDYQQLDEELWEATEVQELVPEMDEWLGWESQRIAPRQREEYQPTAAGTEEIPQQPLREHRPRTALLRGHAARSASLEEQAQILQPRRRRPVGKDGSVSTANREQPREKERLGAQEIDYAGPRVPKTNSRNIRLHALKVSEENNRVRGEEKDQGQEKDNDVEEDEETDEEEWEDEERDEGEDEEEEEEEDDRERLRSRV